MRVIIIRIASEIFQTTYRYFWNSSFLHYKGISKSSSPLFSYSQYLIKMSARWVSSPDLLPLLLLHHLSSMAEHSASDWRRLVWLQQRPCTSSLTLPTSHLDLSSLFPTTNPAHWATRGLFIKGIYHHTLTLLL